jgi:hypothetical protein
VAYSKGEIFEIKPDNQKGHTDGDIEVSNYVYKANVYCPLAGAVKWHKGDDYPTTWRPIIPISSTKILVSKLHSNGVIVYDKQDVQNTNPKDPKLFPPVFGNPMLKEPGKIREFIEKTKKLPESQWDEQIRAFLETSKDALRFILACLIIMSAVVLIIWIIANDVTIVGVLDDAAGFLLAQRLITIAMSL